MKLPAALSAFLGFSAAQAEAAVPLDPAPVVSIAPAQQQQVRKRDELDAALDEMHVLLDAGYETRYAALCFALKLYESYPGWNAKLPPKVRSWIRALKREEQARMYEREAA